MNRTYGMTMTAPRALAAGESTPQFMPAILFVWAGVYALAQYVPGAGSILCYAAAIYATRGSKQTLEAFTVLAFLILMGQTGGAAARWIVVFAGFGRAVWDTFFLEAKLPRILWPVTIFSVTVLFFAPLTSYMPLVSALKVVSFWMGVTTSLTMFFRTRDMSEYWLSWFFTLILFMAIGSALIYATGGGYNRTAAGFQGVTSHPQTFGPVMAVSSAFLIGLVIFYGIQKWYVLLGALLALGGMYLSAARTALLATILGFGMAVFIGQIRGYSWWPRVRSALLHPATMLLYVGMIGITILQWSSVQARITDFLIKDEVDTQTVVSALQSSRGYLMAVSMENFRSEPITGIGFGVPSDQENVVIQTGFLGLPTGASVEKGFMPTAVLEETGIAGAILVSILIILLVRPVWKSGNMLYLWVIFICLLVNLGEMVFFSIGGMGFFFWLMMAFAHTASIRELETRTVQPA